MRRRSNVSSAIDRHALRHRNALNGPEQALWAHLRGGRLGVWFRPQVVLGRFIVDFLAPQLRLVIEVDGGYHATRVAADQRRDRKLARMGYRVLRIDAELVRRDVLAAVARVRAALAQP
jgi:very-short-patch-repair endonuclease